jgi:predicted ester cyclase
MEPFVALMRRYCIDYTSAHDQSVCDDIMSPDYRITISGRTMEMDDYRGAVTAAFRRYPTLVLTVHELMLSGDRLAMRFSEHGAAADDPDHVAVWPGISLYRWDGNVLLECRVEQDFQTRDEQTESGRTAPLEPAHPDPWATTRDHGSDPAVEGALRAWLDELQQDPARALATPGITLLGSDRPDVLVTDATVRIDDLFSAGSQVAAAVTLEGAYAGGLTELGEEHIGLRAALPMTLIADVADGSISAARIVRDRWGFVRRIKRAAKDRG